MTDLSEVQNKIVTAYKAFMARNKKVPSVADLKGLGISRDQIRDQFGNMTGLRLFINEEYGEELFENEQIILENQLFSIHEAARLNDLLGAEHCKRFVITTCVSGSMLNIRLFEAIKNYCKRNKACILVIPSANSKTKVGTWSLPGELVDEDVFFVTDDTYLNSNLFISGIRSKAKDVRPTTGMSRLGQATSSLIMASPKQSLEYVNNSPDPNKMARAIMTTGTISMPDYDNNDYMPNKADYLAELDHVMGAIIVEIEDDDYFHFRQIQESMLYSGAFVDLGIRYMPDGTIHTDVERHLVLGDWHSGQTDNQVANATYDILKSMPIHSVYFHDFFDGKSISHHDRFSPGKMAQKYLANEQSLEQEILTCRNDIHTFLNIFDGQLVFIKGNHDEVLDRYLLEGAYVQDPQNHLYALDLAKAKLTGFDPLWVALFDNRYNNDMYRIEWIPRDTEYRIGGIELGAHGDLGTNGTRGTLNSAERTYGKCVIGHTHSAHIHRGVYRVGTSTRLKLDYNRGPSTWTQTHCLVYGSDGTRQLINIINGKWRLK